MQELSDYIQEKFKCYPTSEQLRQIIDMANTLSFPDDKLYKLEAAQRYPNLRQKKEFIKRLAFLDGCEYYKKLTQNHLNRKK